MQRFRFSLPLAIPSPPRFSSSSPSCPFPAIFSPPMSALFACAFTLRSKPPPIGALYLQSSAFSFSFSPIRHRRFHVSSPSPGHPRLLPGIFTCQRGFRKTRRKPFAAKKEAAKEKQLELNVAVCFEEEMPIIVDNYLQGDAESEVHKGHPFGAVRGAGAEYGRKHTGEGGRGQRGERRFHRGLHEKFPRF